MKKTKLRKSTVNNLITYAIVALFYIVVTVMIATGNATRHMQSLLVPICVNVTLAVSLNLVIGFLGELSLGHAAFMSIGAYTGGLLSIFMKNMFPNLPVMVRFPLSMLAGGIAGAMFGALVCVVVLRLKGDYLAIVTLAFGEILRSIIINLDFTGGPSGLKGVPQDASFTYGIILVFLTLFVINNLAKSKHGRAIQALRDNTIAATSVGINATKYKLMVFALAAFFAGMAGVLYSHNYSIINAGTFDYNKSIEILVMVVLGGIGSVRGSVIAGALIAVIPEMLRSLQDYRMLIYAIVLIVMMLGTSNEKLKLLIAKYSPVQFVKNTLAAKKVKKEEK
ncbi:MAG: branched-chain amino acid ABC transporter permease [Oscillospiraceae bacterium]|nr:branched-chain amino acid ABC transporter permease [Oscillospiraceae bacterium]MBQ5324543.1 branched-chain amino acid ABC transporter permease [Oscillospiraceae bacterium]